MARVKLLQLPVKGDVRGGEDDARCHASATGGFFFFFFNKP